MAFESVQVRRVSVCLAAALLAGCGGGGGGGKSQPSASILPQAQGNAYAVTVANLGNTQPSGQSSSSGSTATISAPVHTGQFYPEVDDFTGPTGNTAENLQTSVNVQGGGITPINSGTLSTCTGGQCNPNKVFSRRSTQTIDPTHERTEFAAGIISTNATTSTGPGSTNTALSSSFYGAYLEGAFVENTVTQQNDSDSGRIVVLHDGIATNQSEMQTLRASNVTAHYNGRFEGIELVTGANGLNESVSGDVGLTANFGQGTVAGNVYNLNREANNVTSAAGYGLRMDGTIQGSNYSGTTAYTAAASSQGASAVGSARGDVIGGFYGTNAAETTGVARISGATPANTQQTLVGSYGAKKQ